PSQTVEGFYQNLSLLFQISRDNPSVSLRLPAPFSREPFLPYSPPPHNLFTNVKKSRQNDKTAGNQTKHPAPNVLNALLLSLLA
ncbi:hypothetical protein, partial [uncultured Ruminococcus sp.]|uniref:hypothetical protein n=2 Tax=Ruminococcus TaxID=1263 RepID=UPI00267116B9